MIQKPKREDMVKTTIQGNTILVESKYYNGVYKYSLESNS